MSIEEIIKKYESVIRGVDDEARNKNDRAYGGYIRQTKGKLLEDITHSLILIAWKEMGGKGEDIEINSNKVRVPLNRNYLNKMSDARMKKHIEDNIKDYHYALSVDKHVFIRGDLVMGIECKSYAENAMIKRILVDFDLLKTVHKNMKCFLFQLESHLGGDYSKLQNGNYGSKSTHAIMSYFNCKLKIVTLLEGERKVDAPIHKYFKPLNRSPLIKAKEILKNDLKGFL